MSTIDKQPAERPVRSDSGDDLVIMAKATDGIVSLTLNRPGRRNVLSSAMMDALSDALSRIADDRSARVVVVHADGPGFCAGHDLGEIQSHRNDQDGGSAFNKRLFDQCGALMLQIRHLPQPVIACVEGVAVAAGCQLVATCDMAVAASTARFGVNGIDIGFFCSTPGVALGRNIGRKAAMELLTTGRLIGAVEALNLGLVNRVVEPGQTATEAMQLAQSIAGKPADVIALGKQAFNRQIDQPVEQAYAIAGAAMIDNLSLDQTREGIDAFIEKRKPVWPG